MIARFTLGLSLLGLACGSAPENTGTARQGISGGEPAPDLNGVVAVINFAGGACSGSLISPRLVLTARHCVADTMGEERAVVCGQTPWVAPDSPGALFVVPLPEITDEPKDYLGVAALRLADPPDSDFCGTDVVLLVLKEPLQGVTPLTPRLDQDAVAGETFTAAGYGVDESLPDTPSGIRKQLGGLEVDCMGTDCGFADIRANEWLGSTGPCQGDSGGPALDSEGRVFGVLSRGTSGCTSPVYGGVASRAEWLKAEARAAAQGNESPPEWACAGSSACERPEVEETGCTMARTARPGAAWYLGAALALFACCRRRRA